MIVWQVLALCGVQIAEHTSFCIRHDLSTNPTIARYALTLAEFDYTVEWISVVYMIADSFSRMTLVASIGSEEALLWPEIVFGKMVGEQLKGTRVEVKFEVSLLMFEPVARVVLVEPCLAEFEDNGSTEWHSVEVLGKAEVQVMAIPQYEAGCL